jgi:hypothetical protein
MEGLRVVKDPEEARFLWEALMPREVVTDLWDVRACFHRHFGRPIHFITGENVNCGSGLLPLSFIEEQGIYAYFPGETWHGKTWLEQNLILGDEPSRLLDAIPGPYHIRYLSPRCVTDNWIEHSEDEIGYLFTPHSYSHDINGYLESFSGKSLKRVRREIQRIEDMGLAWRYDRLEDIELMVAMSVSRFGKDSYFGDPRFRKGFMEMIRLFADHGWLRVTSALIGREVAAVDVGVLYEGTYTLMAGGTNPSFPGIAKVINMHHMERACEEKVREVDFLCGDFNWKKMFHLQERPLFLAARSAVRAA